MKKSILITLILIMLISLSACGDGDGSILLTAYSGEEETAVSEESGTLESVVSTEEASSKAKEVVSSTIKGKTAQATVAGKATAVSNTIGKSVSGTSKTTAKSVAVPKTTTSGKTTVAKSTTTTTKKASTTTTTKSATRTKAATTTTTIVSITSRFGKNNSVGFSGYADNITLTGDKKLSLTNQNSNCDIFFTITYEGNVICNKMVAARSEEFFDARAALGVGKFRVYLKQTAYKDGAAKTSVNQNFQLDIR